MRQYKQKKTCGDYDPGPLPEIHSMKKLNLMKVNDEKKHDLCVYLTGGKYYILTRNERRFPMTPAGTKMGKYTWFMASPAIIYSLIRLHR